MKKRDLINAVLVKMLNQETRSQDQLLSYFKRLKALEFNDIKSLESSTIGLSLVNSLIKERLKHANLSNKQRAEIELIARIECFVVITTLINGIEEFNS